MPTVSFIRTVTTRAVFLRRTSPTCIATSPWSSVDRQLGIQYANCQIPYCTDVPPNERLKKAGALTFLQWITARGVRVKTAGWKRSMRVALRMQATARKKERRVDAPLLIRYPRTSGRSDVSRRGLLGGGFVAENE